jgi:hypothetical protein
MPPRGSAVVLAMVIGEDCAVHYEQPRVVPADQVPDAPAGLAERTIRANIRGTDPSARKASDPDYHIVNEVFDRVGIVLTYLQTDLYWTDDGSVITSGYGETTARWHVEDFCAPLTGWKLEVLRNYQGAGGLGYPYVEWKGFAEWSYNGFFSGCNPTTYYNIFSNTVVGTAGGLPPECSFTQYFKATYSGWRMYVYCYNPFVVKKDETIP